LEVDYILERTVSYDLYLDFDLARSILSTPDSSMYLLSPVLRSFLRHETSEVEGRIRPVQARPVIFAIQGTDTVTTLTDPNGNFTLRGLKEGKHTLVVSPRDPYIDTLFTAGTEIGKTTVLEEILLKIME